MPLEDFFILFSELRKRLVIIALVFCAGAIISFSFMGRVIKKIEHDMFFSLNLDRSDAASRLADISSHISSISGEVNNSIIAQNLSSISREILSISQNLYMPNIVYLSPLEVLMLEFKMSLIFGFLIALPLILYYGYRGMKNRLKDIIPVNMYLIVLTIAASVGLFLIGAGYAYYYMLPFFLSYLYKDAMSLGVNATFSVYSFIYFVVMTTIIIGASFELPVILTLLVHLGITSRSTLAYYRRHAYVLLLIVAAWITPDPTMFSQIMVTVPFIVLYEISLLTMRLIGK